VVVLDTLEEAPDFVAILIEVLIDQAGLLGDNPGRIDHLGQRPVIKRAKGPQS
jgi:hypothetical protein